MSELQQAILDYLRDDQTSYSASFAGWSVGNIAGALGSTQSETRKALEDLLEDGHIVQRSDEVYGLNKMQHRTLQQTREEE